MRADNKLNISLILVLAMLAVSTSPVAAKILNQSSDVDGVMLAFWRMAFASAILWGFCLVKKQGRFKSRQNLKQSIMAGIFLGLHFALFFIALDLTKMANATFLGTLTPVFTLILEIFFLKRTFNRSIYLGLFCALFGNSLIDQLLRFFLSIIFWACFIAVCGAGGGKRGGGPFGKGFIPGGTCG